MEKVLVILTIVIASLAFTATAHAGAILLGGFGPGATVDDFEGLPLAGIVTTPIVINGNTFDTDNGNLDYTSASGGVGSGFFLATTTDLGFIDIVLGTPVLRAGLDFGLDFDSTWSGFVEFFNEADASLGSVAAGPTIVSAFAGWEADAGLIARLRVNDTLTNRLVISIDNLITEDGDGLRIPEPASLALFGFGLLGLGAMRRRKKTA